MSRKERLYQASDRAHELWSNALRMRQRVVALADPKAAGDEFGDIRAHLANAEQELERAYRLLVTAWEREA